MPSRRADPRLPTVIHVGSTSNGYSSPCGSRSSRRRRPPAMVWTLQGAAVALRRPFRVDHDRREGYEPLAGVIHAEAHLAVLDEQRVAPVASTTSYSKRRGARLSRRCRYSSVHSACATWSTSRRRVDAAIADGVVSSLGAHGPGVRAARTTRTPSPRRRARRCDVGEVGARDRWKLRRGSVGDALACRAKPETGSERASLCARVEVPEALPSAAGRVAVARRRPTTGREGRRWSGGP